MPCIHKVPWERKPLTMISLGYALITSCLFILSINLIKHGTLYNFIQIREAIPEGKIEVLLILAHQ